MRRGGCAGAIAIVLLLPASALARPVVVGVALEPVRPAAQLRAVTAVNDPASPRFGRFLGAGAWAQRFGQPPAVRRRTVTWLRRHGARAVWSSPTGTVMFARGPERRLRGLRGGAPAGLRVAALGGLDGPGLRRGRSDPTEEPLGIWTIRPPDLHALYEVPAAHAGAGASVALIGNGQTDAVLADLRAFEERYGFPHVRVDVIRTTPGGDYTDASGDDEHRMITQAAQAMAPALDRMALYWASGFNDVELAGAVTAWAADPDGPPVASLSASVCEALPHDEKLRELPGADQLPFANFTHEAMTDALATAAAAGRTFFGASGDVGSGCNVSPVGVNGLTVQPLPLASDPAAIPYAVGVGGTDVEKAIPAEGHAFTEVAWLHGGGNPSAFEPAPGWQLGVTNLDRRCLARRRDGTPYAGDAPICRGTPDVSAMAAAGGGYVAGYAVYASGAGLEPTHPRDTVFRGGTSLSSPLWAGMWARVAGAARAAGLRTGFAAPMLYRVAADAAAYGRAFHDITVGGNGLNDARPGYDYATGLGVPRVGGLVDEVLARLRAAG